MATTPTGADVPHDRFVLGAVDLLRERFVSTMRAFDGVTRSARQRFEERDWQRGQADALDRLRIFHGFVLSAVADLRPDLDARADARRSWSEVRDGFGRATGAEPNAEIAETFFNSVTRRLFEIVGVDAELEFAQDGTVAAIAAGAEAVHERFERDRDTRDVVLRLLEERRLPYRDAASDATRVAHRVDRFLGPAWGSNRFDAIEALRPTFFRNKGAYIVARIVREGRVLPFVLPLLHGDDGVYVDAVLMREADVSILFSFTRSYFHVAAEEPAAVIAFLRTILPRKSVAELYIALGYHKHGKTELYRSLRRHLEESDDRFELASGDRGLVMIVFTLPGYDMVFKVIRDRFEFPKNTTAVEVRRRYRLVFERDRVGRLVEAQEFHRLGFPVERFAPEVRDELLSLAAKTVRRDGDLLVLNHLYTERRVYPLNLYLREARPAAVRRAVVDYGRAIKELAAANIFPGDFLLKNFGVTRHGRVVFYDYDELCLLTDCRFRRLPVPRNVEEELASEPQFTVGEDDVFPEEFRTFLGLPGPLADLFESHHGELFAPEFWRELQERHRRGEIMDFYPYPQRDRLR
jgi:isocitrate dehydrogenase kinase/phosphatase